MNHKWPWWLTILLAALCYLGLRYGIPAASERVALLTPLARLSPLLAPLVTIALLLLGAKQLYDGVELPTADGDTNNKNNPSDHTSQ